MLKNLKKFFYLKILKRKYYRIGSCNRCGKCCKRIYVKTFNHVIKDEKDFKRLQYIHRFYSYLTVVDKDDIGLLFSCCNYDEEKGICLIHKDRPGICRRYPQEEIFHMEGELSKDCGYKFIPIESFSEVLKQVSKKAKSETYSPIHNTLY